MKICRRLKVAAILASSNMRRQFSAKTSASAAPNKVLGAAWITIVDLQVGENAIICCRPFANDEDDPVGSQVCPGLLGHAPGPGRNGSSLGAPAENLDLIPFENGDESV